MAVRLCFGTNKKAFDARLRNHQSFTILIRSRITQIFFHVIFCFQEYKKEQNPEGAPAGQYLGAMLVAQEVNEHQYPVYGCYVIGADWYFMILRGDVYAISPAFVATREDISDIFRILKSLKEIIMNLVRN